MWCEAGFFLGAKLIEIPIKSGHIFKFRSTADLSSIIKFSKAFKLGRKWSLALLDSDKHGKPINNILFFLLDGFSIGNRKTDRSS
ncbi:hypothetical protein XELAEV_18036866mg [Xenopus laevis]|uniref:Uncharacterized protein n=1 Tax=Xenopus laevis TaxID=8355 RepID=A0A974CB49_XENLA|nr:hypothetical protein XELAEV_18036866mg [Xenopus laevis]